MTGITCAVVGSGTGSNPVYTGTATVTVGFLSAPPFSSYGKGASQGSITPTTWAGTGLTVSELKDVYVSGVFSFLTFEVAGSAPNSGWSTITIGGTSLNRASATYNNSGATTQWTWGGSPLFGTSVGATRSIVWA